MVRREVASSLCKPRFERFSLLRKAPEVSAKPGDALALSPFGSDAVNVNRPLNKATSSTSDLACCATLYMPIIW